jgi:hypothetical protein
MKIVYRAGDITEAEIVRGMLLASDIEAHVSGFYLQGGIGETAPLDLAMVHVPDADFERARDLVREYEGAAAEPASTTANSEKVESSRLKKLTIAILVILAISILSYWVGL